MKYCVGLLAKLFGEFIGCWSSTGHNNSLLVSDMILIKHQWKISSVDQHLFWSTQLLVDGEQASCHCSTVTSPGIVLKPLIVRKCVKYALIAYMQR